MSSTSPTFVTGQLEVHIEDAVPLASPPEHDEADTVDARIGQVGAYTIPELEHLFGPLDGMRILDFGSGTGATAVALRSRGAQVFGFDISETSSAAARQVLASHGYDDVQIEVADRVTNTSFELGSFDLVFANAVIEHIPKSVPGLRAQIIADAFAMVKPGGAFVVCQSQNRLYPRDIYLTGKWWLPWTKPGSARVYRKLVAEGWHPEGPTEAEGRIALEQRGMWGFTYWELRRHLPRTAECVHLDSGLDSRSSYTREMGNRRRIVERALYVMGRRGLRQPIVAFTPMFWPLAFRKPAN